MKYLNKIIKKIITKMINEEYKIDFTCIGYFNKQLYIYIRLYDCNYIIYVL